MVEVLGVYVGSFAIAIASGVFPIVNAELYLIGLVLAIGGIPEALLLAVVIAAGQMIGKGLLFLTARGASKRWTPKLERFRLRVQRWRSAPHSVTFVSAAVGRPPLSLLTVLAGILEIRFRMFLLVGFAGRTLRFGTIGLLAALA